MSRFSFMVLTALAAATSPRTSIAQIRSIPEFTGDAQEKFDCSRLLCAPCMAPRCPILFGSRDNSLCTPRKSGCDTPTAFGGGGCVVRARSDPTFFVTCEGVPRYTFDPPVARFGGYFAGPVPKRGENGDAYVRFRDEYGNLLGTRVARVGDGDCEWHWNGWESTGTLIAEIDVEGMLRDGAFIGMDDMEISYEAEVRCDLVKKLKLTCRDGELRAMVKSRLEPGVELTIIDNGEERVVKINKKGKATAKLSDRTGRHRVIIKECPKFDKEVECGN